MCKYRDCALVWPEFFAGSFDLSGHTHFCCFLSRDEFFALDPLQDQRYWALGLIGSGMEVGKTLFQLSGLRPNGPVLIGSLNLKIVQSDQSKASQKIFTSIAVTQSLGPRTLSFWAGR
jgi:hypothetical protein